MRQLTLLDLEPDGPVSLAVLDRRCTAARRGTGPMGAILRHRLVALLSAKVYPCSPTSVNLRQPLPYAVLAGHGDTPDVKGSSVSGHCRPRNSLALCSSHITAYG
jgi:hypothetical protein